MHYNIELDPTAPTKTKVSEHLYFEHNRLALRFEQADCVVVIPLDPNEAAVLRDALDVWLTQ